MRFTIGVLIGFGFAALTSCGSNSSQQQASNVVEGGAPSSESESVTQEGDRLTEDVHAERHLDGKHSGAAHEMSTHHGGHRAVEADHVESPTPGTKSRPRAHSHGAAGHAHSREQHAGDDSKRIAIGDKVPEFEVTIADKKWKLSELQQNRELTADGTLVLTFWCSFCHSCRHVEHALDALAKQHQGTVGIVALDASAGETTEGVAEFAMERELTLPIALDATGAAADIFGTRVTTTTVVIDKDGLLRYRGQFGDNQHPFAEDALRAVLAGDDVPVQETRQKG